jgi:GR25 family glycosyltransferase involved in LPS biosynthesis
MILYNQPKTFVITLDNLDISESQFNECLESAKKFNWTIEKFSASRGTDITENSWKEISVTPLYYKKTMELPGVWGCFFSHFRLWNMCIALDEPIVILEHDSIIQGPWPNLEIDNEIVKLHKQYKTVRFDEDSGNWTKSAHAYCLLPKHAKTLINFSRNFGAYAVDVMIGSFVIPFKHYNSKKDVSLVERQHKFSTTNELHNIIK